MKIKPETTIKNYIRKMNLESIQNILKLDETEKQNIMDRKLIELVFLTFNNKPLSKKQIEDYFTSFYHQLYIEEGIRLNRIEISKHGDIERYRLTELGIKWYKEQKKQKLL